MPKTAEQKLARATAKAGLEEFKKEWAYARANKVRFCPGCNEYRPLAEFSDSGRRRLRAACDKHWPVLMDVVKAKRAKNGSK